MNKLTRLFLIAVVTVLVCGLLLLNDLFDIVNGQIVATLLLLSVLFVACGKALISLAGSLRKLPRGIWHFLRKLPNSIWDFLSGTWDYPWDFLFLWFVVYFIKETNIIIIFLWCMLYSAVKRDVCRFYTALKPTASNGIPTTLPVAPPDADALRKT
jgi:hypothetical protein